MRKILVCEDDPDIVDVIEMVLAEYYEVQVVPFVQEDILDIVRMSEPDFMIVDLRMPKVGGEYVVKEVKSDPDLQNIPMMMLSADKDLARIAESAGADAYINKPFDIDILLDVVGNFCNRPRE